MSAEVHPHLHPHTLEQPDPTPLLPALLGAGNGGAHAILCLHLHAPPLRVPGVVEGGGGAAQGEARLMVFGGCGRVWKVWIGAAV